MTADDSSPPAIDAVPLRHPWRWVAAFVIIVLVALFLWGAATNDAYHWSTYSKYLVRPTHFDRCLEYTPAHPPVMLLAVVLGSRSP